MQAIWTVAFQFGTPFGPGVPKTLGLSFFVHLRNGFQSITVHRKFKGEDEEKWATLQDKGLLRGSLGWRSSEDCGMGACSTMFARRALSKVHAGGRAELGGCSAFALTGSQTVK